MKDFPETFFGLVVFALGFAQFLFTAYYGRRAATVSLVLGASLELTIIVGLFFDWGYDWVNIRGITIALNNNIWLATPHLFGMIILALLAIYGPSVSPWLATLCLAQAVLFLPVLYYVEADTDTSFLTLVPVGTMYLATESAFCFLAYGITCIPESKSKWWKIAYGRRAALMSAITALAKYGFEVFPPQTVLDAGAARGAINGVEIVVTTKPSLFPPGYGLQISFFKPGSSFPVPQRPCFADKENLISYSDRLLYRGRSNGSFTFDEEGLLSFINRVVSRVVQ